MAYKDSGLIGMGSSYNLGEYTFTINTAVEADTKIIQAHCSGPEGNAAKGISVPTSTQLEGWYVEANETEASVYVKVKNQELNTGDVPVPVPASSTIVENYVYNERSLTGTWTIDGVGVSQITGPHSKRQLMASETLNASWSWIDTDGTKGNGTLSSRFTFQDKTVYYAITSQDNYLFNSIESVSPSTTGDLATYAGAVAWTMIYGVLEGDSGDKLVARFAIKLEEAGGFPGGGGDWDEEGDYDSEDYPDPDEREPDDPTYTLYLTVTGALSGRHNDPLNDTSYSYTPADKAKKKHYGCGGDGGHGGGGGGGASTVVVKKFATSRADSKDITVSAKRHGYGSGGGKGGKGGDGIVLIYY